MLSSTRFGSVRFRRATSTLSRSADARNGSNSVLCVVRLQLSRRPGSLATAKRQVRRLACGYERGAIEPKRRQVNDLG